MVTYETMETVWWNGIDLKIKRRNGIDKRFLLTLGKITGEDNCKTMIKPITGFYIRNDIGMECDKTSRSILLGKLSFF